MITYDQARVIMWDDPESSAPSGTTVSSISALNNAIASASAGSVIRLQNGTYNNAWIDINGRHGSPGNPIKIFAATPGQVTLTGRSQITVRGQSTWVLVNGFVFKNGFLNVDNRYVIPGAAASIELGCRWCRLCNISLVNYSGPTTVNSTWLWVRGFFNRLDHNFCKDKTCANAMMKVRKLQNNNPESCRLDHNRFINFNSNAQQGNEEVIQIGQSDANSGNANCLIDNNWIDGFDNPGESEVISIKSSQNMLYRNVVKNFDGYAFVMRHGNRHYVDSNFVIGGPTLRSGGIRVAGSDSVVSNNYLVDLNPTNFGGRAGLLIHGIRSGGYNQALRVEICHNTIINTRRPITIGTNNDSGPPQGIRWRSNSIDAPGNTLVDFGSGSQMYVPSEHTWETNHFRYGTLGIPNPGNIGNNSNPQYSLTGGIYRMASGSPLIGAAAKRFGIIHDFEMQVRGSNPTIGCDEFSSPVGPGPLQIGETGPTYDVSGL